jgi:xylulokinase
MTEIVLGVDSSTQSTKVCAIVLENGELLATGRSPHLGVDRQNPADWWNALREAIEQVLLQLPDRFEVSGISIAAQQHGCVTLD